MLLMRLEDIGQLLQRQLLMLLPLLDPFNLGQPDLLNWLVIALSHTVLDAHHRHQ